MDRHELMVVARRVLLDALTALDGQLDAVTVVGAQAVYLRTPHAAVSGAVFTSDGDLSIDPRRLGDRPLLEEALRAAGFSLMYENQPGLWAREENVGGVTVPVELDLLVPRELAPKIGRRSAKVPPHGLMAARWIEGLELAAVDRSPMTVTGLDGADIRSVEVDVAGPTALLVAKAFKIRDRLRAAEQRPDRLSDKDAADVLRIMMTARPGDVAATFEKLRTDDRVGAVAVQGLGLLRELFGAARTPGVEMAVSALRGDVDERRVRALAPAFVSRLG
ncbi:hypothetical protein JNUCC64_13930 [Streptomyces sp. JNUCC 64]